MTVIIENETAAEFDFDYEAVIRDVAEETLLLEGCPYEAEVSVLITDDPGIREINSSERGLDTATDVLSFPMAFYEIPGDFSRLEEDPDVFDPDSGAYILGDIVLSADRIRAQADLYGHSEKRELAFLTAHSMLHLMGYDHMNDPEREVMERKQEAILSKLGIGR